MRSSVTTLSLAVVILARLGGHAQAKDAGGSGVKEEMLFWIENAEEKLVALAEAMPESKYSWRPSKDARSTGEVFMHVASGNFGIPSFAGVKPPAGFDPDTFEKSMTKKADIEKALKDSFAHAKKGLSRASAADLNKRIVMFGEKTTFRDAYFLVLTHAHEHLGQSIAYARSNDIVPPWSVPESAHDEGGAKKEAAPKKQ
jgi:uncharacterized damage-inducible protein DinB